MILAAHVALVLLVCMIVQKAVCWKWTRDADACWFAFPKVACCLAY